MIALLDEHHEALRRLCEQFGVARLEIFGSAATGEGFDPAESDLDFLVEFVPLEPEQHARAYVGLLAALEDLFGRPIDLVEPEAIRNPYLLDAVNESRTVVYAA